MTTQASMQAIIQKMAPGRKVEFFQSASLWPYDCMIRIDGFEQKFDSRDLGLPVEDFKKRLVEPFVALIDRQREHADWLHVEAAHRGLMTRRHLMSQRMTRELIRRMAPGRKVEFFHDIRFDCDILIIDGFERKVSYRDSCLSIAEFKERIVAPMISVLDDTHPLPSWDDIASRMAVCG